MTITTIATLKGGQSKSFITGLICKELAALNMRVLAVSICSQNNLFLYLGGNENSFQLYDAINDNNIKPAITKTNVDNVDMIHNDIDTSSNVDQLLQTLRGGESRLKFLLSQVEDKYDHVVLDTGPNLGISTIAAIIPSHNVISPLFLTECGYNGLIATRNAINELIEFKLTNCRHLGIVRSCTNVNRDKETFKIEDKLSELGYNELGTLPKSTALRNSLKQQTDYSKVPAHHLEEVNKLMSNILNEITCLKTAV